MHLVFAQHVLWLDVVAPASKTASSHIRLVPPPPSSFFAACKSGALGHGDTNKRAVGRQVKSLAPHAVHGVACGADFQLAVAGWRPPTGKGVRSGSGGRGSPKAAPLVTRPLQEQQRPLQQESPGSPAAAAAAAAAGTTPAEGGDDAPAGGFKYAQVEPSSPRSPRQHASLAPGSSPSTPRSGRQRSASSNGASTSNGGGGGSGGPRLRGRSGREQRWLEEAEEEWAGGRRRGRGERRRDRLRQPPDATPEATLTRRQRWMQEPPTRACLTTPPDSDGEEEEQGGGGGGGRHDWRVAYLIRRQLKVGAGEGGGPRWVPLAAASCSCSSLRCCMLPACLAKLL